MTQDEEPDKFQFPQSSAFDFHRQSSSLETFDIPCASNTPSLALSTDTAVVRKI